MMQTVSLFHVIFKLKLLIKLICYFLCGYKQLNNNFRIKQIWMQVVFQLGKICNFIKWIDWTYRDAKAGSLFSCLHQLFCYYFRCDISRSENHTIWLNINVHNSNIWINANPSYSYDELSKLVFSSGKWRLISCLKRSKIFVVLFVNNSDCNYTVGCVIFSADKKIALAKNWQLNKRSNNQLHNMTENRNLRKL